MKINVIKLFFLYQRNDSRVSLFQVHLWMARIKIEQNYNFAFLGTYGKGSWGMKSKWLILILKWYKACFLMTINMFLLVFKIIYYFYLLCIGFEKLGKVGIPVKRILGSCLNIQHIIKNTKNSTLLLSEKLI